METVNQDTGTELNTIDDAARAVRGMLEPDSQPAPESEEVEAGAETEAEALDTSSEEAETSEAEAEEGLELSTLSKLAEQLGVSEDDLLNNLRLTEKVNGEEREVTLADLRKGHMMEADYRRKTSELAEARKAFEAQQQQVQQEFGARLQQADALVGVAEQQLLGSYNSVDWDGLRQSDPTEFLIKQQEYRDRYAAIQQAKQGVLVQAGKLQEEYGLKQQAQMQEVLKQESEALLTKLPEWRDEAKAKTEKEAIRSYLKSNGFDDGALSNISDHRAIVIARKAMLYDQMQQKKPELTKKLKTIPKVQKPGAAKSKQDIVSERTKQGMAKLRKSGDYRDAAALLRNLL